jgi:hypothetical protein
VKAAPDPGGLHASFTPAPVIASHQPVMLGKQDEICKELIRMKLNGKRAAGGLAVAGLAAAGLAGGGVALASARTPAAQATAATATAQPRAGWCARDPGDMPGMVGMRTGQSPAVQAAAAYLGLSQAELRTRLQAGQSLADLARAQHKPVSGLEDAMAAAMASRINASHALTATQKAAMLRVMRSHLDDMVNTVPRTGAGMGWMSRTGGMGIGHSQEARTDR